MKQTAVEWLELNMETLLMDGYKFNSEEAYNLYDQAKKMEKEQHKKTWFESTSQFGNESEVIYRKDFDQYYNETFKKE